MIKQTLLILLVVAVPIASLDGYNLQTTSVCVVFDTTYNVCSKWQQNGTINSDASCFIGQTLVKQIAKGFVQIKDLQVGDKILTLKSGQQKWSLVEGWIHKNSQKIAKFNNLTLQNGQWIGVSGKHNIAFASESLYSYNFAFSSIESVSKVFPSLQTIEKMSQFSQKGFYAPLTSQSSYLVYTSNLKTAILAHDFSHIKYPEFYQSIAQFIFGVFKIFNGVHLLNSDGMNIAAQWMMYNLAFLMN